MSFLAPGPTKGDTSRAGEVMAQMKFKIQWNATADGGHRAFCPDLGLESEGATKEEARKLLKDQAQAQIAERFTPFDVEEIINNL